MQTYRSFDSFLERLESFTATSTTPENFRKTFRTHLHGKSVKINNGYWRVKSEGFFTVFASTSNSYRGKWANIFVSAR